MTRKTPKQKAKQRDDYECQFCGMQDAEHKNKHGSGLEAHHILKQRVGGGDIPSNYITVCKSCHATIEKTQAKGIAQVKDTLETSLTTKKNNQGGAKSVKNKVVKNEHWEHDDYGTVKVLEIHKQISGYNEGVVDWQVEVEFIVKRTNDDANWHGGHGAPHETYKEPYGLFIERANREAHYYADDSNEVDGVDNGSQTVSQEELDELPESFKEEANMSLLKNGDPVLMSLVEGFEDE
jgi:hypothetical protein